MRSLKEIIKYLKKERIIYKLDGDNKEYSTNLLNYLFNWHKIWEKSYKLRDNVSEICFKDCHLSGKLNISNCSKVIVFGRDVNFESFSRYGNENSYIVLDFFDSAEYEIAHIVIKDAQYINYDHYFRDLVVKNAKNVEISSDKCNLRDVVISSDSLELCSESVNIRRLDYMGDKVNFNNSNGKIRIALLDGVSECKINNCSLESTSANFDITLTPIIKDSVWMFDNQLQYKEGTIGNEKDGFILDDDTFNKDKCIDLERAYVSYTLSKVLEKINDINEEKEKMFNNMLNQDIDEVSMYLDNLETQRNEFRNGLDDIKVKRYSINKKN